MSPEDLQNGASLEVQQFYRIQNLEAENSALRQLIAELQTEVRRLRFFERNGPSGLAGDPC